MKELPCPFCQNPNASNEDVGDACCFCDYQGVVTVGKFGTFSNITQYDKVYNATNHSNRLDELHMRDGNNKTVSYDVWLEYNNS